MRAIPSAWIVVSAVLLSACTGTSPSTREQARVIAGGNAPCTSDLDCCVVIDQCINQALVVRASDKDKVASLVAEPDPRGCTLCMLPAVQVSCMQGQCAGVLVDFPSPDGGTDGTTYSALSHDHCRPIAGVPSAAENTSPPLKAQAILGCGAR